MAVELITVPVYCRTETGDALTKAAHRAITKEPVMHYRNGREAKNGDKIVKLDINSGRVVSFGVLHSAVAGNDYCNGYIAPVQVPNDYACMCDCLHIDDVAEILGAQGLDKRPEGM